MRQSNKSVIALTCEQVDKTYQLSEGVRWWHEFLGLKTALAVHKLYALQDISIDVIKGKIVGILGHNGAGKSTLLRVMAGIYSPTKGKVSAYGPIAGLFELGGMGNPSLSGKQYALRYLQFMGVSVTNVEPILLEIQDFSELGESFEQPIRTYSSGMAARLYFATATALQHEIYLIDELLTVGDMHFQSKCWNRMRKLLLNGASGVLVTHDWTAAAKLCENTGILERGKMKFFGSSDQAVVEYLSLPMPTQKNGRFSKTLPKIYTVIAGENFLIPIPIELDKEMKLGFGASIEILRVGIGWETIILHEIESFNLEAGQHDINFSIESLPIGAGKYSLNLFLAETVDTGIVNQMDARTWTLGNGLDLYVSGEESDIDIRLPYTVEIHAIEENAAFH
jgi:lipopolysaccharide transport system ATP-binding protein